MTDTTMRDKLAGIVWEHETGGVDYKGAADAILAALPDMIAPLVWVGVENDCFVCCDLAGKSYQLVVFDTLERSCDYNWSAAVIVDGNELVVKTPAQASFADAQAAANTHHRASIMEAFKDSPK